MKFNGKSNLNYFYYKEGGIKIILNIKTIKENQIKSSFEMAKTFNFYEMKKMDAWILG